MNDKEFRSLKGTFNSALTHAFLFSRFVFAGLVLLYLLSGIFSVSQNEIGVHLRMGRVINETVQPGIHYRMPWPFDTVVKVAVREVKALAIDDFQISSTTGSQPPDPDDFTALTGLDSYCITGDNNLATVSCVIQYTIFNPCEYLFGMKDPEKALKNLACKAILHCMAKMPIDDILTRGKQSVANHIQTDLQKKLDELKTGINISFVEIKNISPPDRVAKYFSEVVKASIDRGKSINEAQSYRNEIIPRAKAQAMEKVEQALGYKKEVILTAQGKTARFNKQLEQAGARGSSTWDLIYNESMKEIMNKVGTKHIVHTTDEGKPAADLKIRAFR